MSVSPSCMQRTGIPSVGLPLSFPWSFQQLSPAQNALTLQVQIPSFPRPVIASQLLHKDSMEQKNTPVKPKSSPTSKSTPTPFTIASILSKNDDRDKYARDSPIFSQTLNVTGHASTAAGAGSISPSTPLSGTPKTPFYYISYHPAAQPAPFPFPAAATTATAADHELQRNSLTRIGAPPPLTLGDCMVRRYGTFQNKRKTNSLLLNSYACGLFLCIIMLLSLLPTLPLQSLP